LPDSTALVYLDNAATTFPKPEVVYQAMDTFYRQNGGNAGRGANPLARSAANLVNETRSRLRAWLEAPEVIFSPSATIALNTVILGARLRDGDVVYVTPFEHNSVLRPLEHLRTTAGIEIRVLPFDGTTFECRLDEVKKQFRLEPPSMICVTQVSNVFGAVMPVDALTESAKKANPQCVTCVDGAQSAGLIIPAMNRVDALVYSGHKALYGPYGVAGIAFGTMWRPQPLFFGGTGTQSESLEMPAIGPARFEAGSQNISALAGLHAALGWIAETGRGSIHEHVLHLSRFLVEELGQLSPVRLFQPLQQFGIVSFTVDGASPQAIETLLGAQNIAVRAGLHCAPWAHHWAGTKTYGGTTRVSMCSFSSTSDVIKLCRILKGFC
jgi:selenocysteine lyase/cysteine desulfurase